MAFRVLILALCTFATILAVSCGTDNSEVGEPPEPTPTPAPEPPPGSPGAPGSSNEPRANHTATLMPDGAILAVAGSRVDRELASVESFDPQTGIWTLVSSIGMAREGHTATLLPDGRALVAGGAFKLRAMSSVEIYDPASDSWTDAAPMNEARSEHTATLLPDGTVLVAGGAGMFTPTSGAEIYDPASDTWSPAGGLSEPRAEHTATLLADGRVAVAGGAQGPNTLSSVDVYDPSTSQWSSASPMTAERSGHTATLLSDGRLLIIGGRAGSSTHDSTEILDPATMNWTPAARMNQFRAGHAVTVLEDGRLLVTGGGSVAPLSLVEIYDPALDEWSHTAKLLSPRVEHTSTLLADGTVLVAGGRASLVAPLALTELYIPGRGLMVADGVCPGCALGARCAATRGRQVAGNRGIRQRWMELEYSRILRCRVQEVDIFRRDAASEMGTRGHSPRGWSHSGMRRRGQPGRDSFLGGDTSRRGNVMGSAPGYVGGKSEAYSDTPGRRASYGHRWMGRREDTVRRRDSGQDGKRMVKDNSYVRGALGTHGDPAFGRATACRGRCWD